MKKTRDIIEACSSLGLLLVVILLTGCVRSWPGAETWQPPTFEPVITPEKPTETRFPIRFCLPV